MNLLDVFNKFPQDMVDKIEKIGYLDGEDSFEIEVGIEVEGEMEIADIWLFGDGDTGLSVVSDGGSPVFVADEIVDFYNRVREIWRE